MLHLTADAGDLTIAVDLLRAGKLVALPTETVYGLAADATNPGAVRAIFHAKGRPPAHPLIVHLAEAGQLPEWADAVPQTAWRLASAFWPGPLTMVLPAARTVSRLVTGGQPTVALRVPAHPVFQSVLRQLGRGLAAPSANPFGLISPTVAEHVQRHLAGKIAAVVDGGPCTVGIESTIVDLTGDHPCILRPGMVTASALAQYLPGIATATAPASAPRVPGTLAAHYAPRKPCYRIPADLAESPFVNRKLGLLAHRAPDWPVTRYWAMPEQPDDYARVLYSTLHQADAGDCDILLIALPPDEPSWAAVHDRLRRATRPCWQA